MPTTITRFCAYTIAFLMVSIHVSHRLLPQKWLFFLSYHTHFNTHIPCIHNTCIVCGVGWLWLHFSPAHIIFNCDLMRVILAKWFYWLKWIDQCEIVNAIAVLDLTQFSCVFAMLVLMSFMPLINEHPIGVPYITIHVFVYYLCYLLTSNCRCCWTWWCQIK